MKKATITFGRMNPPTSGHEKLIHATHKVARKMGTKAHIVLSHSYDKKNNPLPQKHKINYVKIMSINDITVVITSFKLSTIRF